ncbi:allophanate hydrolase [Vibrio sp. 2-Bac 85]
MENLMIQQNMNINVLQNAYRSGELNVKDFLLAKLAQAKSDTSNVWISTISESQLVKMLDVLDGKSIDELPLYGVPFAVKDNIDFAMLPTTAGCEAYTFQPDKSSTVVQLLIDAGAIPFGKTNLDQFATGLVGVRSPWGAVNNSFDSEYVSGGSSSGSAVAVATGQVSFSLGTDTAGSGRVPAALNNIVGMKATKGLLSCTGVVPACKSLDCVTIFANSANEVNLLLNITGQWDETDCFSRENKVTNSIDYFQPNKKLSGLKVGLPAPEQLSFFGDQSAQILFSENVERLKKEGIEIVNINFQPFLDAAKLLYEGPWVAERYAAIEDFFKADPKQCLPVIETIIGGATAYTAVDTFKAMYRLQAYKIQCDAILAQVDCVLTPTAGCAYRIKDVEADPIQLNSNLGYYTNFMNLLDYAAIALPAGILASGLPFGITLFGPAFSDRLLLSVGAQWQKLTDLTLGATQQKVTNTTLVLSSSAADSQIDIAVCGAHLSGFPLNNQLTERGGVLVKTCNTSTDYRFYALAGGPPFRPGLIRVDDESGSAIEVEVWRLPVSNIGTFLQGIEQPLGLGKVQLDDNSWVSSFICEGYAINTAEDITHFGGWKAYIKAK